MDPNRHVLPRSHSCSLESGSLCLKKQMFEIIPHGIARSWHCCLPLSSSPTFIMPLRIIPRRKRAAFWEQYSSTEKRFFCTSHSRRLKGSSILPQTWGVRANHCLYPAIPAGPRCLCGFSVTGCAFPYCSSLWLLEQDHIITMQSPTI